MPILDLEFEVFCSCGNGLCNNSTEGSNRHSQYITVEPCAKCLESSYDEGHEKGHEEGYRQCEEDNEL